MTIASNQLSTNTLNSGCGNCFILHILANCLMKLTVDSFGPTLLLLLAFFKFDRVKFFCIGN